MEGGSEKKPADIANRVRALTEHGTNMLVEAGAGSGKTSTMAGKVAMLIAGGEDPAGIVAISYTVAAASELRGRIERFLTDLARGICPKDLSAAFPHGVPPEVAARARMGLEKIDGLVATTIHGFCQTLLRPYPLEAGMDPGAEIVDPEIAVLAFEEAVRSWLRDILNAEAPNFTATLFELEAGRAEAMAMSIALAMQKFRGALAPNAIYDGEYLGRLRAAGQAWLAHYPVTLSDIPADISEKWTPAIAEVVDYFDNLTIDPVAALLVAKAPKSIAKRDGGLPARAATKKSWVELLGKNEGNFRGDQMTERWEAFRDAWTDAKVHAAAVAARRVTEELQGALQRYTDWKISAAFIDFEDLLIKARDLLASNDIIRRRLGARFRRILVDEFQDTDPLQAEIVWRLCGDPVTADSAAAGREDENGAWKDFRLRPGSLFLVGDPKQAIYRFRGADIEAYLEARTLLTASGGEVLPITVNFRSTSQVLSHVNTVYEPILTAPGQPGFASLVHHRDDEGPAVQLLSLEVPGDVALNSFGEPTIEALRSVEAKGIAACLQRMIGSHEIPNRDGGLRKVEPGDIALLMPSGTEFWIYEKELEKVDIPIAAQAGKGFLQRQEILDMTALARLLSDPRDSLALGAFLRGPVIGFTDEEILDAVESRKVDAGGRKRLSITMDIEDLVPGRFKDVMERLQHLRHLALRTTPYQVLSAAVEVFSMRAVLTVRHPRSVERSFANLDAFLGLSRAWDTRGLKSFADELRRRREENARQAEGRPDSGGDAVSIVTIHSSKGLEWPIVIPANCITTVVEQSGPVLQRAAGKDSLLLRIFGEEIEGFQQAQALEREERARECHRLLYVADTRARDLLVIPKLWTEPKGRTWASLCPGRRDGLGDLDITLWADPVRFQKQKDTCAESREAFQECSRSIVAATRKIVRITPSRHETESEEPFLSSFDLEVVGPDEEQVAAPPVAGSSTRGILLHKLMEELLTGELEDANVTVRAAELIAELGAKDIAPRELADTISRTRAIPEVAALWPDLIPEFDVGSFNPANGELRIGVIDAGTIVAEKLDVVVDWKSDVAPAPDAVAAYAGQVREYLKSSGARRGLIVLMTPGTVVPVEP